MEVILRGEAMICEQQYGFMRRKSNCLFAFRLLMEKYSEGQIGKYCVFVDLEPMTGCPGGTIGAI